MSSNIHPTKPLGSTVNYKGGNGSWNTNLNNGAWYTEEGFFNSYPVTGSSLAVFPSISGNITVGSIHVQSIQAEGTFYLTGGSITFPGAASISSLGSFNITSAVSGVSDLTILGTGTVALSPSVISALDSLTVDGNLRFNSASNVNITADIIGSGNIEITGGGHILVDGVDAGNRSFTNPPGFTGTFITPSVNSFPVFTSPLGTVVSPIWTSYGIANTIPITATDADGDTIAYSIGSPSHGSASIDSSSGLLTYTPTSGYMGSQDQFTVSANDGYGGITTRTLTFEALPPYDIYVDAPGHQLSGTTAVSGNFGIRVAFNPSYKVLDRAFTGSGTIRIAAEGHATALCMDSDNSGFSGTIELVKYADVFVGDSIRREWNGVGINYGNLGTATLSVNWNGGFSWYNFSGTTTLPHNTTDSGGLGAGGYIVVAQGAYHLTGTLAHHGTTSVGQNCTATFDHLPTNSQLCVQTPWPNFYSSGLAYKGHAILPSSPSLSGYRIGIMGLSSGMGAYSNELLVSWSGTASGVPRIFDGFAIELSPTVSGSNRIYTASSGAVIVFNPASGIKVSAPS